MSDARFVSTCAACGAEESLDSLLCRMVEDDQVRVLIASVMTNSFPLGGSVVRYLRLWKPHGQKLRLTTVHKVLAELVPDIHRAVIERSGRIWAVSQDDWQRGFESVFDAATKGTLALPLKTNGYLYEVLMRGANQVEAKREESVEAHRRGRAHAAGAQSVGALLEQAAAIAPAAPAVSPQIRVEQPAKRVESPLVRRMKAELAAKQKTNQEDQTS